MIILVTGATGNIGGAAPAVERLTGRTPRGFAQWAAGAFGREDAA